MALFEDDDPASTTRAGSDVLDAGMSEDLAGGGSGDADALAARSGCCGQCTAHLFSDSIFCPGCGVYVWASAAG